MTLDLKDLDSFSMTARGFLFVKPKDLPKCFVIQKLKKQPQLPLLPGCKNYKYWRGKRNRDAAWLSLREAVLHRDSHTCRFCGHFAYKFMEMHHLSSNEDIHENLVTCCKACHITQHIGWNMGLIEIWKSPYSQVEIVKMSRKAFQSGKSLESLNERLKLTEGPICPMLTKEYANSIMDKKSKAFSFSLNKLDPNLKVIFVNFEQWQLD